MSTRRSSLAALVALAVLAVILAGKSASATELGCSASEIPLAAARVDVRKVEEGLVWDVRYIVDVNAAQEFNGGVIPFAVPLLPGEDLRAGTLGIEAVRSNGRITGVCVTAEALHDRAITASFLEPRRSVDARVAPLGAPIARGAAVHVVDTGPDATHLVEVSGRHLERNVGYVGSRGIGHGAREEARRLTGGSGLPFPADSNPIFVRGDDIQADGFVGRIVDARALARSRALGVGAVFLAVVAALALAARWLRQKASIERADALLASEIDNAVSRSVHRASP